MKRLFQLEATAARDLSPESSDEDGDTNARAARGRTYDLRALAEHMAVDLPSSYSRGVDGSPSKLLQSAMAMELKLVRCRMDVALSDLRRGLVDQAYIFRRDIRQSSSSGNVKLGYDAAKKAREHARAKADTNRLHADTYRALRKRADDLHWDKTSRPGRTEWNMHVQHYKPLSAKDIECNTATYDVKDHSGRLDLPWFWKLNRRTEHSYDDDAYIADCKQSSEYRCDLLTWFTSLSHPLDRSQICIHALRGGARQAATRNGHDISWVSCEG